VPEAELDAFCEDVLGPLLAYDRAHASALLETLGVYLRANENLRRTAERLFVHVNTVNYRLRRIEAITGLDLADSRQRLIAEVALETVRLLEPSPERAR
jgi:PucR family transcriptional regulator, purine catabolism regulatory protein